MHSYKKQLPLCTIFFRGIWKIVECLYQIRKIISFYRVFLCTLFGPALLRPTYYKEIFSFLPFKSIIHVTSVYWMLFLDVERMLDVIVVNEMKEQDRWMDGKEEKHHLHHHHQHYIYRPIHLACHRKIESL